MLSVRGDDRLRAAVLAVKAANSDLKADLNRATRETIGPVWTAEVQARATTALDQAVIAKGARLKAGNPPILTAATSTRKLRGGLIPGDTWAPFEFGGTYNKVTTYDRLSPKGNRHKVTRHTARQVPARRNSGRVAMPAFAEVAPRAVSLWVQLIVRTYNEALEGRRS